MNQKLRTARSGIVILFAVLCIVCLSLSLALSAHFAAYAAVGDSLDAKDSKGNDLWQVHYTVEEKDGDNVVEKEVVEGLSDGIVNGKAIDYLDTQGQVAKGTSADVNCFTPYRGEGVTITLKLNPDYEIDGTKLSALYNLDTAVYMGNSDTGSATASYDMPTTVTAQPLPEGGATEALTLEKSWVIATLCNRIDFEGTYIGNRVYGQMADYALLRPVLGDTVVYAITSTAGYESLIAVKYEGDVATFWQAGKDSEGKYFVSDTPYDASEVNAAASRNLNLINYKISELDALIANSDEEVTSNYTLTVAAVALEQEGILYAQSEVSNDFNVVPQSLGSDVEGNRVFETLFNYTYEHTSVAYKKNGEWVKDINFKLTLKSGVELVEGEDYEITSENNNVGSVDLLIVGTGNLEGYHTISGLFRVTPTPNDWYELPNIISWTYGTFKAENNRIIGMPIYLDNPNDVTFRIVKLVQDKDGKVTEDTIEGLTDIHYYVYTDASTGELTTNGIVDADAISVLEKLGAGNYRLYASVYGVSVSETIIESERLRNYQPIEETKVDFTIFKGTNSWKAGAEPKVKNGGWTEGKLDTTDGLIDAASELAKAEDTIMMIYKLGENGDKDTLIYSNIHPDSQYGDINVLKSLKAGRYYLRAEVEETDNYSLLNATVIFTVSPNRLPDWAVVLIVVGALGIVALVFGILHQKGVLQMLTGKVIISMRTRANVDATLAAIRAAKVAREAEASIAAAKAREAEEQVKSGKSEDK